MDIERHYSFDWQNDSSSGNDSIEFIYYECVVCGRRGHPDFEMFRMVQTAKYAKAFDFAPMTHQRECPDCGFPMRVLDVYT